MRIGMLGTGVAGRTLAGKLTELGHDVKFGSRDPERSFADAAAHGELVFNATAGTASLEALRAAGADNLAGKVLADVANPLDASQGFPPILSVCNTESLAEQIQGEFPDARVVKTLNTMNADVMVNPGRVPGDHNVFVAGDDDDAKDQVRTLLESFGWPAERIIDLGAIGAARGLEMYLPLWLGLFRATGTAHINIAVMRAEA
ncbi:MAG: NADPH-dependent F420 reductase [Thermoleophilaceae bacterium]|jgi:8-hydroxy-5-deazaflavin:NADPH oxidoreductase